MTATEAFTRLDEVLAGVQRTGIVHVGAHKGQEVPLYRAAGFERIVLVEPNPRRAAQLRSFADDVTVHECAAGPPGTATLHVTRWDEQSSLLTPDRFDVRRTVTVPVRPLTEMQGGCNVAVVDVQGYELEVLRSADLDALDVLIVECSTKARYAGEALRDDIHAHLADWTHVAACPHRWPHLTDEVWRR